MLAHVSAIASCCDKLSPSAVEKLEALGACKGSLEVADGAGASVDRRYQSEESPEVVHPPDIDLLPAEPGAAMTIFVRSTRPLYSNHF